ncbi:heparinase II/III family protein [Hyphococcus flavus]|uniref:Heparinase II/III family protein n=1 Tax=Hyphococcus flavus TaxID=1866326 RepID=A0AAE9ZGK8_9PROT|nr:heparinase II/III family protein [Hyphococcus flavus]WDI30471.1 heparinase II/III family protein [Hyphococcus flavus]
MNGRTKSSTQVAGARRSSDVLARVRKAWGESPFYQAQLKGPAPDRLLFQPADPYAPDKQIAMALANGRIAVGGESIDFQDNLPGVWDLVSTDSATFSYLQEFSWLRHLSALGEDGKKPAREILSGWLDRYERWSSETWDPYFVSERLVQLCSHHPLVLAKSDALWRSRVLACMARQTRHLARTAHRSASGFDRLMTSLGLAVAGYCLPGCEGPAERGLEMARRELRIQLRPDGGHVSRNPSRQLKLALRLQSLTKAIEARGYQAPGFLRHMVQRTSTMAAFFRCADGGFAVFNGGYEDDAKAIIEVQSGAGQDGGVSDFARHTGYHKLSAARSLLIVDTSNDAGATSAFKSGASMHFSSGRSRIFVNCGNGGHRDTHWRKALEQRSAHTALSFETAAVRVGFAETTHRRAEEAAGHLLEVERRLVTGGAEEGHYTRRLYLSAGGADLRGEETLDGLETKELQAAVWRFHLHPGVKASLARDKKSVILLLPNKEGWRFKSNCPELTLEKSVYCGLLGAPAASEQIVISARQFNLDGIGRLNVKWALKRLDRV